MTKIPPKKEESLFVPTVILSENIFFLLFTLKLLAILSKRWGGAQLSGISLLWPSFARQSNKAIFSSLPKTLPLHFDSAPADRGPNSGNIWSSYCGSAEMNPTSIHEDECSISGLLQWVRDPVLSCCGVGHRYSSDPVLLCLWHRQAAIAQIWPLAWELPYVLGVVLKSEKRSSIMAQWFVNPTSIHENTG